SQPRLYPEGVGRLLPKGADLVMQIHYHPDGVAREDQSTVAIYLHRQPVKRRVATIPLVNREIDIPAGVKDYERTARLTLPIDTTIIGLMPHMHLLGREMIVSAEKPDGTLVPLLHIDDWDFRWQDLYRLAEPLTLPRGTTLLLKARYDNSSENPDNPNNPPQRVRWGEQTTDEMCLCAIEYVADSQADIRTIRRALLLQRLVDRLEEDD
ncbi:MAG: alkyl hydroperoxide reductase, partial [Phycisphaerae bacterium]|nr:alkyl hydroperoxide reductase [Phycisphaerae bacterium]MDW8261537.1 hypothetical protein [Phycisphaerales bacterium]